MPKYRVTTTSGRDFIMHSVYDSTIPDEAHSLAYEAMDEAVLMDDYLVDVEMIDD